MARRKPKGETREEVLRTFQDRLAEHFDAGVGMVCWEERGETNYLTFRFGNAFAVEAMGNQLGSLIDEESDEGTEEAAEDDG